MFQLFAYLSVSLMLVCCLKATQAENIKTTIHVFGDSHARLSFRSPNLEDTFVYPLTENGEYEPHQFIIHWLGPVTMHRMGRDGLQGFDVRNYGVNEEEIVVFSCGEIDTRAHIVKQRDLFGRPLEDVIDSLVINYCDTMVANQEVCKNITFIVSSVIPPVRGPYKNDPDHIVVGSLADRIIINRLLNARLKEECKARGLGFASLYELFHNEDGSLNESMSSDCLHVDVSQAYLVRNALLAYLKENYYSSPNNKVDFI